MDNVLNHLRNASDSQHAEVKRLLNSTKPFPPFMVIDLNKIKSNNGKVIETNALDSNVK